MATLKELTWEFHKNAERQDFARKLLKGELTKEGYAEYLANQYFIYEALERFSQKAGILDGIEDICRAEAIKQDLDELGFGGFNIKDSAVRYSDWCKELYENTPEQLLAHIYVRHFGDLHGGQMIAKRVPGSGAYYQFDGKEKDLIAEVRSRLDGKEELFVDEAIKCFEFATELFKELSGE